MELHYKQDLFISKIDYHGLHNDIIDHKKRQLIMDLINNISTSDLCRIFNFKKETDLGTGNVTFYVEYDFGKNKTIKQK